MKKNIKRILSFVMAMFMVFEVVLPSTAYSIGNENEDERKHLYFSNLKIDEDIYLDVNEKENNKEENNEIKISLKIKKDVKNIKLVVKKGYRLFNEDKYEDLEEVEDIFEDLSNFFEEENLELDAEIVEIENEKEEGKNIFKIQNNFDIDEYIKENSLDKDFKDNYNIYSFKVKDEDIQENELNRNDNEVIYDFPLVEEKDEDNMEKNKGEYIEDFGVILDDEEYSIYKDNNENRLKDSTVEIITKSDKEKKLNNIDGIDLFDKRQILKESSIANNDFSNKEFILYTSVDINTIGGKIPKDWYFEFNIGEYLTGEDVELKDLKISNEVIAKASYNKESHKIIYRFIKEINSNGSILINQPLKFDLNSIGDKDSINIKITYKPKNMQLQNMKELFINKSDSSPIYSGEIIDGGDIPDSEMDTTYPYSLEYFSHEYFENGYMNWDITIDTSKLYNRDDLIYSFLGLALYAPEDQGLSDYRVTIDELNVNNTSFVRWNNLYKYDRTILKANIPEKITINVRAKVDVPANTYTLGLRLTPSDNYIQKLADNLLEKAKEGTWGGLFGIIIEYVKNIDSINKFKKGFNLIDVRLNTSEAPQSTYDEFRATSYGDTSRTMFSSFNKISKTIDFTVSDTLRLEELNDSEIMNNLANDIYNRTFNNAKVVNINPDVKIFIPNNDGTYILKYSQLNRSRLDVINRLRELDNEGSLVPGTIIQYTWHTNAEIKSEASSITIDFQNRTYTDGLGNAGGKQNAYFIQR